MNKKQKQFRIGYCDDYYDDSIITENNTEYDVKYHSDRVLLLSNHKTHKKYIMFYDKNSFKNGYYSYSCIYECTKRLYDKYIIWE